MSELHAETVPFVRGTMLPQASPPAAERGLYRWLRTNLFSGPLNTVLTIVALFVLRMTYFGRDIYATGGNATAARLAGVNVPLVSVQHQYVVTEKIAGVPSGLPTLRDPDRR